MTARAPDGRFTYKNKNLLRDAFLASRVQQKKDKAKEPKLIEVDDLLRSLIVSAGLKAQEIQGRFNKATNNNIDIEMTAVVNEMHNLNDLLRIALCGATTRNENEDAEVPSRLYTAGNPD